MTAMSTTRNATTSATGPRLRFGGRAAGRDRRDRGARPSRRSGRRSPPRPRRSRDRPPGPGRGVKRIRSVRSWSAVWYRPAGSLARQVSTIVSSAGGRSGRRCDGGDHRLADVEVRDRHRAVAGERHDAGEHLVEHDAERVDVGAGVDREALRLLGREVGGGPHDRAGAGEAVAGAVGPGDAEVGDLHLRRSASISTLPGLMSRCTTPARCAAPSALAMSAAIFAAATGSIGPRRSRRGGCGPPRTP